MSEVNLVNKYNNFVSYVAEGYSNLRGISLVETSEKFEKYNVNRYLINGYHPLARHNRKYISRKIDEFIANKDVVDQRKLTRL